LAVSTSYLLLLLSDPPIYANITHFLFVKEFTVAYCECTGQAVIFVPDCGLRHVSAFTAHESLTGGTMGVSEILAQIDKEIAQLHQARALLSGKVAPPAKKAVAARAPKKTAKKRNLTPEGRRRIAEAVKRRWAEQKKAAGSK
jgi:hypothetical protein